MICKTFQHTGRVARPLVSERAELAACLLALPEIEINNLPDITAITDKIKTGKEIRRIPRPNETLQTSLARKDKIAVGRHRKALQHLHGKISGKTCGCFVSWKL